MKTSNSSTIKIENIHLVMEKIFELRETSRIELSKLTTLTKATVSSIVSKLLEKNLIIETNKLVKTSGRSAKVIALNKHAGRIMSLELLPDHIYGAVTDFYGKIVYDTKKLIENNEFPSYLKVLLEIIDELKSNVYETTYGVIGIGIAVYGILSNNKKIKYAPFTSWQDIELKEIVEKYTGIETYVENEANIQAMGEHISNPDQSNILSLNVGIGVGMGIIINGRLYTGNNGYAGEVGHTIVIPNGRSCVCGNKGCLETYISDTALINDYKKLTNESITIKEFTTKYKENDPNAIEIYKSFIEKLSIAINNISQVLNPRSIIINSKIVEEIPESISTIKNNLVSKILCLDTLSTSVYTYKTNVLGISNLLIHSFLNDKSHFN